MSDSLQAHQEDIQLVMRRLWGVIAAGALIVSVWQACVGYGLRSLFVPVLMLALGAVTHVCLGAMIRSDATTRPMWIWVHMLGTFAIFIGGLFLSKALGVSAIVTGLVLICEHFVVFIFLGIAFSRIMREHSRTESASYNEEND
ncbi:hypothetical protein [uncultured Actinomyces sp.]|uniref:hypothetical protein n=1 Tax=uncultured Actinomyces sp. TaxID=249061 RepID=UPI0028E94ADC|nr:hypothetical protein [uncultured Actinomyces sp.]